ncbi:MAG TPA: 4Fe-4S binding protein [bacterium]
MKVKKHRIIRWAVQLFFLALFIFFFIQTSYISLINSPQFFFSFDPLILVITSIAFRAVIAASLLSIVILVGTLVFGRFYCGFACPLGTLIDLADRLTGEQPAAITSRQFDAVKYLVLVFLVVTAVLGSSFLHFFDPLVITEQALTLIAYPITTFFTSVVSSVQPAVFREGVITLLNLLVILGAGFFVKRAWCRFVCPLGGLLGLTARVSLFKVKLMDKCTKCGACESVCPVNAIDAQNLKIDSGECIACLRCVYTCQEKSAQYGLRLQPVGFSVTRRQVLAAGVAGIVLVPLSRTLLYGRLEARLIRPPGAVPEPEFLNACVRCATCMKVCPTNGLQPCLFEAGLEGLWTPRLVPRIGGCEKNCSRCGQVCPTSAIRKLSLEEKSFARLGTAVIDRSRCIAWEQDKVCLICDEACQYNAITSRTETIQGVRLTRPYVDERICMGCGICESRCPLDGRSAIEVYSMGEERKRTQFYVTPEKRRLRDSTLIKDDIPSGFILK